MFNYDQMIRDGFIDPNQLWVALDSFWRDKTAPSTRGLVKYLEYGSMVLLLNNKALGDQYTAAQDPRTVTAFDSIPWIPLVIFQDLLLEDSAVHYGDGYIYDDPPEILYGQDGPTTQWVYPIDPELVGLDGLTDSITTSTVWFDHSTVTLDLTRSQLRFDTDPFDLIPSKTAAASGKQYIVLWIRNAQLNLEVPRDTTGWTTGYTAPNSTEYARSMAPLWRLILYGPSSSAWIEGLNVAMGFPVATTAGTVRGITNDGAQDIVITDTEAYTFPDTLDPAVQAGDDIVAGEALTTAIKIWEYDEILDATQDQIPGVVIQVPLSTGVNAALGFANVVGDWTYDAGRPSPWRFTISGEPADVEQFWVDVDTYATANSIDFETLFGLPAAVNPMGLIIEQLLQNNLVIAAVQLSDIAVSNPAPFADRAQLLMTPGTMIILHQGVGSFMDVLDLAEVTSETVSYGYHEVAPTETISVSGTDLTYTDYAPGVFLS